MPTKGHYKTDPETGKRIPITAAEAEKRKKEYKRQYARDHREEQNAYRRERYREMRDALIAQRERQNAPERTKTEEE